ncbi:MAG: hypothetical protein ABMA26_00145 [Limisphaerales bacterium]
MEADLSPAKRLQLRMLFSLRFMQQRDLRATPIPDVIAEAVKANDLEFFIELGKTLKKRPAREGDYPLSRGEAPMLNKLEQFLLSRWTTAKDGLPELFYLTPEGLAAACNHWLRAQHITPDAVVKLRQRLGLKPFKRQKIHVTLVDGKLRIPQLDKLSSTNPVHDRKRRL